MGTILSTVYILINLLFIKIVGVNTIIVLNRVLARKDAVFKTEQIIVYIYIYIKEVLFKKPRV